MQNSARAGSPLLPQHQLQSHAAKHKGTTTRRQAIEPVSEVGGIALGKKHKQTQGPDQPAQGKFEAHG